MGWKKGDPNHPRRGSGAGWGGAARGGESGSKARKGGPGRGNTTKTVAELMISMGLRQEAAERWKAILEDPAHPKHADMVAKAAERMDGAAVQRIAVHDVDPDSLTDAELAAIAARGRSSAPHGAEGDQD